MIHTLLERLRSIDFSTLNEDSINELLDNRDESVFDKEWCRVYNEVEKLKNEKSYTSDDRNARDRICEEAFMIIEENGCSELSDYVADDFGLIYDSIVLGYNDTWLSKLTEIYKSGKIPSGEL